MPPDTQPRMTNPMETKDGVLRALQEAAQEMSRITHHAHSNEARAAAARSLAMLGDVMTRPWFKELY